MSKDLFALVNQAQKAVQLTRMNLHEAQLLSRADESKRSVVWKGIVEWMGCMPSH